MILPGQQNPNGIGTDQFVVDPNMTESEVRSLAAALIGDCNRPDKYQEPLGPDFVVNAINLSVNDVFILEPQNSEPDLHEVVRTNQYRSGFATCHPGMASRHKQRAAQGDWAEYTAGYGWLWKMWLQGRVVPCEREVTYRRQDTDKEVEV